MTPLTSGDNQIVAGIRPKRRVSDILKKPRSIATGVPSFGYSVVQPVSASWISLTLILRGLAVSATGIVIVKTPWS